MIFDSVFNSYKGVIGYYKIVNGSIKKGDKVKFVNTGSEYDADEVGILRMDMEPRAEVTCGDVGYICSGIKTSSEVKVGDTITHQKNPCEKAIAGFEEVKPMVFAGVYPIDPEDYENLRASLENSSSTTRRFRSHQNRHLHSASDSVAASSACSTWKSFRSA